MQQLRDDGAALDEYTHIPIIPEMYEGLCQEWGVEQLDILGGLRIQPAEDCDYDGSK